ncbi:MAG: aldo/keto reductase [Alphaproteobacteria bacterium]|nr:aldo/keto reductase [Alphaproteobacteria bacterium]
MRIAYGFWRYGPGEERLAREMIACARDLGVDHFDTADVYGAPAQFGASEELLGNLRRADPSLFDGASVATKVGVRLGTPYDSSPEHLSAAIDASLRRLRLDCVDLLYIHRPDMLTHPSETAAALDRAIRAGKAKAVGASNFSTHQVEALATFLDAPLAAHQLEFSALAPDAATDGRLDQAMAAALSVYAWSPLAGGRIIDGGDRQATGAREALQAVAAMTGVSLGAAALGFTLAHPAGMTPIVGTRSASRLTELAKADGMGMSRADWYAVYEAATGRKLP